MLLKTCFPGFRISNIHEVQESLKFQTEFPTADASAEVSRYVATNRKLKQLKVTRGNIVDFHVQTIIAITFSPWKRDCWHEV